jgi:hypothetical protein
MSSTRSLGAIRDGSRIGIARSTRRIADRSSARDGLSRSNDTQQAFASIHYTEFPIGISLGATSVQDADQDLIHTAR